ncbi:MAG: phosphate ABC transporter substrate-binding protein, partial [Lachnospiraceae bacterium]
MRKNGLLRKCMAMVACAALSMAMVTGCSKDNNAAGTTAGTKGSSETTTVATTQAETQTTTEATKAQNTKLSGTISLSGSTSMQKLADALAESFMEA